MIVTLALAAGGRGHPAGPEAREVVAGVLRSWPPQYGLDGEDNPIGFAIDVMNEIAARTNVRVTYRIMENFAEVEKAMRDGLIDIIPNSGVTPERAKIYLFTSPVETFAVSIFVRTDTSDIETLRDLSGRHVAVVETNVGQSLLKDRKDIDLAVHRDVQSALFSLLSGQVDALVYPQPVVLNLARQIGVEDHIKVVGAPLKEIKRGIQLQKDDAELLVALNQAVEAFVQTPAYGAIYVKWYGRTAPFWSVRRLAWAMGGAAFMALLIMALWRYRSVIALNKALRSAIVVREQAEEALRKHEERFRAVVNNSPAKIHIKDLDGRFLLVNRHAERLFGVTDEEARGKASREIFPGKIVAAVEGHDRAVLESGQAVEQEEEWNGEDGVRTYLTVKFPILSASGEVSAIGAIGTDITERKLAEEGILAAKTEAEIANRTKSEFLATMSHELRTPLNAIIGFSEIIGAEAFGPIGNTKYLDYIVDIHGAGQHLLELINDILDLSKVESGMAEVNEEVIEIPRLAESVARLVRQRAEQNRIELSVEVSNRPPDLRADTRKLKQILVNLLTNAIKFTEAGGEVTLKISCPSDSGVIFQIVDTGIGMAPEDIPKALSQFGQVDSDLNRKYQGTGLGLPLTKALVELHGGRLDLMSQVGVGTTVTIRFPLARTVKSRQEKHLLGVGGREAS